MTTRPAPLLLPQPQGLRRGAGQLQAVGFQGLQHLPATLRPLALRLLPASDAGTVLEVQLPRGTRRRLPRLGDDESYRLQIRSGGVRLEAAGLAGARHGLHTLSQLYHQHPQQLPQLDIDDAPRHPWRGLLVDSARRVLPLDALLRLLDTLAAAKLNVLHWHLCDDQAWRLESPRFPRLQQQASGGFHYTLDQAARLVDEAAQRGIRVLPELDLPGHCWALGLAYPELLCAPAPTQAQTGFGVFPCAVDPTQDALYDFLDGVLAEWAQVFPDAYLHLGGDELAPQAWQQLAVDRDCSVAELQSIYTTRIAALLRKHRRRLVAWDEMGDAALPPGSLLQAWRGGAAMALEPEGLAGRLRSAGYYLDQSHAAAWHWRRPLEAPKRPVPPPPQAAAWALQAQLGTWRVEGRLWCDEGQAWLQLRSSGTLDEWLQTTLLADPLAAWRLRLDSDLGELELWGPEPQAGSGQGWLRLGNLRVRCAWWALPEGVDWPPRHRRPSTPLLGGEAALWGELVEAPQLALRSGPRLFAIAERLWRDPQGASARSLAASLDERLAQTQAWLQQTVLGDDPLAPLWSGLAPGAEACLREFAAWLEPGAGYARQHSKKLRNTYHQQEALDRLADLLPAESPWVTALGDDAARWREALREAQQRLPAWRSALLRRPALHEAEPLLPRLQTLFALGQQLWRDGPISAVSALRAQRTLHAAASLVDEMVPALVQALQRRLDERRGLVA